MTDTAPIPEVAIELILPSPENPRRRRNEATLQELAASIKAKGILQPLLLRPRGPFRVKGHRPHPGGGREIFAPDEAVLYAHEELNEDQARRFADVLMRRHFEIVAGERRWRAACLAGLATVPAWVRALSDADAAEIRWIENLQREDLDPIDEAHGLARMLALTDDSGRPRYTVQTLAARLHKSEDYVHDRLPLVHAPAELAEKIRSGEVSLHIGKLIGRVPSQAMREDAAQKVLHPALQEMPLTYPQTARLIREHYCRELRGAPFNREDPELVPNVPACSACLHNSANQSGASEYGRRHMCTNLECYRGKTESAWQQRAAKAAKEGKQVLTIAECEAIFPPGEEPGIMAPGSPWIELGWTPEPDLLKREIESPPRWRELIGDVKVPLVIARDQGGRVVELADRRLCMEAAVVNDQTTGGNESAIFRESEKKVSKPPRASKPPAPAASTPSIPSTPPPGQGDCDLPPHEEKEDTSTTPDSSDHPLTGAEVQQVANYLSAQAVQREASHPREAKVFEYCACVLAAHAAELP